MNALFDTPLSTPNSTRYAVAHAAPGTQRTGLSRFLALLTGERPQPSAATLASEQAYAEILEHHWQAFEGRKPSTLFFV